MRVISAVSIQHGNINIYFSLLATVLNYNVTKILFYVEFAMPKCNPIKNIYIYTYIDHIYV